ncbi:MAG: hypothetical protein IKT46_08125 [Clostridia bacterium]|nr:hypothetical protein [Clostridia bacterium]
MKKVLFILLVLILVLSICACKKNGSDQSIDSDTEAAPVETAESTDTTGDPKETGSFYQSDDECYEIDTPYCKLYFPVEWQDITKIETEQTEKSCIVSFSAMLDDSTFPLYAIVFGESETGYPIVELATENGTVSVFCEDRTTGVSDSLTEESKDIYFSMSEDVNVIISNLIYTSGAELSV